MLLTAYLKKEYTEETLAVGSTIQAGVDQATTPPSETHPDSPASLSITAGNNLTVQGSYLTASGALSLSAANDLTITGAAETMVADTATSTKKRGALSGKVKEEHQHTELTTAIASQISGDTVGLSAGTTKLTTTLDETSTNQIGSTVGSGAGRLSLTAGKDARISGSDLIGATGIQAIAQNITIEGAATSTQSHFTSEFKQKGFNLSVGNKALQAAQDSFDTLDRSRDIQDNRLKALYGLKAYRSGEKASEELQKARQNAKAEDKNIGDSFTATVGFSSSSQKTESFSSSTTFRGSSLTSLGDITLIATGSGQQDSDGYATDGDLNIFGSTVNGDNVYFSAARDVNLKAQANTMDASMTNSGKSSGFGVTASLGKEPGMGYYLEGSKSSGNSEEHATTWSETQIIGNTSLTVVSGRDTNLIGAQAYGNNISMDIGRDFNLESLQDIETYSEKSQSVGGRLGIGTDSNVGFNKGKTNSIYQSVNEQTGVFAGDGGFHITVKGNTDLKGAVISSEAPKERNRLSTGTLTFSDIENKAEYSADCSGYNLDSRRNIPITPNTNIPVSDDANSTTKSAISPSTITVGGKEVNPENLNRDPVRALNALGKIFDKKTVQERQELANLFNQEAAKLVGDIAEREKDRLTDKIANATTDQERKAAKEEYKRWMDSGTNKIILHTVVGGLTGQLGSGDFLSGAAGAGFNEIVQKELKNIKDPALHQIASALAGGAAAKAVGGNAQTGAATAVNGTKYNFLSHWQKEQRDKAVLNEDWDTVAYWDRIDKAQNYVCTMMGIDYKSIDWKDPKNAQLLQTVSMNAQEIEASPAFQKSWMDNLATVDTSTLISAGVVGTAIVVGGVLLYRYNGAWVRTATGTGAIVPFKSQELINELAKSGVKYTPENVVAITRTANGNLVWLETGNAQAGLQHIMRHADDFATKGIANNQISDLVMTALNRGQIVAYQGQGTGRPIYEVMFNGVKQHIAITVGNNGFIVGANPISLP